MMWQKRAATAMSRRSGLIFNPIAVLVVATLLSGCGPAWQPPSDAAAVAYAASQAEWSDAGQVTVVPESTGTAQGTVVPQAQATGVTPTDNLQATQFAGKVENLPGSGDWTGPWQVGGRLVHVTSNTNIDQQQGSVAMGAQVAVQGWRRADGSVDAGWIVVLGQGANLTPVPQVTPPANATPVPPAFSTAVPGAATRAPEGKAEDDSNDNGGATSGASRIGKPVEFRGTVQQMPRSGLVGTWIVDGQTINVNAHTRLQRKDSGVQRGMYVQIMGWQQADGAINAASLQVKKPNSSNGNGPQKDNEDKNKGKGNGNGQGEGNGKDHK